MKKIDFYSVNSYDDNGLCIEIAIDNYFLGYYYQFNDASLTICNLLGNSFEAFFETFETLPPILEKNNWTYGEFLESFYTKESTEYYHETELSLIKTVHVNSPDELEKELACLIKNFKQDYPELFL